MSADGTTLAYTTNKDERNDILTMSIAPAVAAPKQVTANGIPRQFLTNLVFSADRKTIFYDKQEEVNTISMFEDFN